MKKFPEIITMSVNPSRTIQKHTARVRITGAFNENIGGSKSNFFLAIQTAPVAVEDAESG